MVDKFWKYGKLAELSAGTASGSRQLKMKKFISNHLLIESEVFMGKSQKFTFSVNYFELN